MKQIALLSHGEKLPSEHDYDVVILFPKIGTRDLPKIICPESKRGDLSYNALASYIFKMGQ